MTPKPHIQFLGKRFTYDRTEPTTGETYDVYKRDGLAEVWSAEAWARWGTTNRSIFEYGAFDTTNRVAGTNRQDALRKLSAIVRGRHQKRVGLVRLFEDLGIVATDHSGESL